LHGVSTWAEVLEPSKVVSLLARYLDCVATPLRAYGATVQPGSGDAFTAYWPLQEGAGPSERAQAARSAVQACLEIRASLLSLNDELQTEGLTRLKAGMGLHRGRVIVGEWVVGGRTEHGIIGSAANAASRIEGFTAQEQTDLLVSAEVLELVPGVFETVRAHELWLRGQTRALQLFGIVGMATPKSGAAKAVHVSRVEGGGFTRD
jgi:adenylate cyclase